MTGAGAAMAIGIATSGQAQTLDDYKMLGINSKTGELIKYGFVDDSLQSAGTIQLSTGTVLTGIEGSAYVPLNSKIFGFWNDPTDHLTKLVYINTQSAAATIVGQDLGAGLITGAVAAPASAVTPPAGDQPTHASDAQQYQVYAVQEAEPIDFEVTNEEVVPTESYAARVTVLGSAITAGGSYDMPVTLQFQVGGVTMQPFGAYTQALGGDINDGENPRTYLMPNIFAADTPVTILAQSWDKTDSSHDGSLESHWQSYMAVDSSSSSQQVITLRHGDAVPNIPGFMDQNVISYYIQDYIDTDTSTVKLSSNQAIYLFELGTTDLTSSAADFQDAVVLVTLAQDLESFVGEVAGPAAVAGTIHINPNNSPDNRFTLTKTNGEVITRDDLHQGTTVDTVGVLYSGDISSLRVKPNGNGSQNSLVVDGQAYTMDNNTAYVIFGNGTTTATIYNDSVVNGQPMGHWHVNLNSTSAIVGDTDDEGEHSQPARLIKVNPINGSTQEVMTLERVYNSLAATSSSMFYGTYDDQLYAIDPVAMTETLIGSLSAPDMHALEFAYADLYGFTIANDRLVPVNPSTGQSNGPTIDLGTLDLGTINFMRVADEQTGSPMFD